MKIYFDQTSSHGSRGEECQGECRDCSAYSNFSLPDIFPLSQDELLDIQMMRLQHSSSLYRQQISEEKWLLCNPVGPGHVIVLDTDALTLFELFRTPHMLSEVGDHAWPSMELAKVITLFVKLKLLRDATPEHYQLQEDNSVLTAWLHVTNSCNLRCSYCYIDKNQESMSCDTAYKSIDAIFRSATKNSFNRVTLKYAGGEASMHLNRVIEMHEYALQLARENHIALSACILSNGVYLSQKAIDEIKKYNIFISLSLDGIGTYQDRQRSFSNGFGSFKYVDRTIQKLLLNSIFPAISITVSQQNIDGLPELIEYILDRNLPFSFNYYRENIYSEHIRSLSFTEQKMIQGMEAVFKLIEQRLPRRRLLEFILDKANLGVSHQYTCGVGRNYLVIDQHGGITKCQTTMRQPITSIDEDDPLQLIRDDRSGVLNLAIEEKEGCQSCLWRYWCTGGCPALTYQVTGRYDVKSPNCNIYQALFPAALRLEAKRLLVYEPPFSLEKATFQS